MIAKTRHLSTILLAGTLLISFLNSCKRETALEEPSKKITPTDYSVVNNWLSLPVTNYAADVFYLYPTSYQKVSVNDPNICTVNNAVMAHGAALAFERQATAFETCANIYAPFYRQADAGYTLNLPLNEQASVIKGYPATDAIAAFDYYIKNLNKGRPYILAGHSQGSNVLLYILSDYMKANPEVYKRMIAAYVIGYSVTADYLAANPHLKFAQGADDLGVIISYNTEADSVYAPGNPVINAGALAINPITWTTDETPADASQNLGSIKLKSDGTVIKDANGNFVKVMNYADARVNNSKFALICSTVSVDSFAPGNAVFPRGVFHSFDYPFYYYNIRENATRRIQKYLNQ